MTEWPLESSLTLGALPTAAACARLHAKHLIWEWGLHDLADDAELIVSELVTNALQASTARERTRASRRPDRDVPYIELRLLSDKERVLIEVWDDNDRPPTPPNLESDGIPVISLETGRGLFLVESLSARWGYYVTPAAEAVQPSVGKVVWALMSPEE